MKRLLIVYNPRSSRYADVKANVLDPAKKLRGYMVGKYQVAPTNLEDNIAKLSKLLQKDDLVVSAGGDATGIIASNAILKSGHPAMLGVMPYGNFNDLARTLGSPSFAQIAEGAQAVDYYPLEIYVDGKFLRFATCYVTIGMTAAAVELYDTPAVRKKLKRQFGRAITSYTALAGWYFKNRHKRTFLPEFSLNGAKQPRKTSDYVAVNGRYMARVMNCPCTCRDPHSFSSTADSLASFWRLFRIMFLSIFRQIPTTTTTRDLLTFTAPSTVEIQTEGESVRLDNVKTIEIRKGTACLKTVQTSKP